MDQNAFLISVFNMAMPLPSKRKGQSRKAFMDSCLSNPTVNKDFPDTKQRYAVCMSQYDRKRTKAAYIVQAGDDEVLYTKSTVMLSEALIEKVKSLPESGPGYHNARALYKSGKAYSGKVKNCEEFETDDDEIEDEEEEMEDIEMND